MPHTNPDDHRNDAECADRAHRPEQPPLHDRLSEAWADDVKPIGIEELLADLGLTEIGAGETAEEIIAAMDADDERERAAEEARLSRLQQITGGSDAAQL